MQKQNIFLETYQLLVALFAHIFAIQRVSKEDSNDIY